MESIVMDDELNRLTQPEIPLLGLSDPAIYDNARQTVAIIVGLALLRRPETGVMTLGDYHNGDARPRLTNRVIDLLAGKSEKRKFIVFDHFVLALRDTIAVHQYVPWEHAVPTF